MTTASTDVIRRIFDSGGRYFIEVGPWPDDTDLIELRTIKGEFSADFYGPINLALPPDFAREIGKALIAAADELTS